MYEAFDIIVVLSLFPFRTVIVPCTSMAGTSPTYDGTGVNVTFPFALIVNVPLPSTVTEFVRALVIGSINLRSVTTAFVTPFGSLNVGVASCGNPWIFVVVLFSGVTFSGVTLGV